MQAESQKPKNQKNYKDSPSIDPPRTFGGPLENWRPSQRARGIHHALLLRSFRLLLRIPHRIQERPRPEQEGTSPRRRLRVGIFDPYIASVESSSRRIAAPFSDKPAKILGARIGQDFRIEFSNRYRRMHDTHRARCCRGVAANLELAAEQTSIPPSPWKTSTRSMPSHRSVGPKLPPVMVKTPEAPSVFVRHVATPLPFSAPNTKPPFKK